MGTGVVYCLSHSRGMEIWNTIYNNLDPSIMYNLYQGSVSALWSQA